jgi:hypothetical protein
MGLVGRLSMILAAYHFGCMAENPKYFSSYKHHLIHVIATGLYLIDAFDYVVKWVLLYNQPYYATGVLLSYYRPWVHVLGWYLLVNKVLDALINIAWPEKAKVDGSIGKKKEKEKTYSYNFTDGPDRVRVRVHFHGGLPEVR